jgi:hypothetical protein
MTISGGIINTFFALVFAIILIAILWGLATYFTEFGSDHGKREGKALILGSVSWLFLWMVIYALVLWVRSATGI